MSCDHTVSRTLSCVTIWCAECGGIRERMRGEGPWGPWQFPQTKPLTDLPLTQLNDLAMAVQVTYQGLASLELPTDVQYDQAQAVQTLLAVKVKIQRIRERLLG